MKQNYRKYVSSMFLVWAGAFIIFIFAYMILLSPQGKTRKSMELQFEKVREQHEQALTASNPENKSSLLSLIDSLREKVGDYVIDFENSSNLTFDISQLADQLNISALSSKTKTNQPIEKCNHISENQISVSFSGTFKQFLGILNLLERHRPVVFVDRFSVVRSELTNDNEVSMELTVFVSKRPEVARSGI
jgi:hypothetical protein